MYSAGMQGGKPRTPYHEFYADDFTPREHYRLLWEHIKATGNNALEAKAHESQLALQAEGVTFTVYGESEEGIERIWPFDLIPRIITAAGVGQDRVGAQAAGAGAEPLSGRPVRRTAHHQGRRHPPRTDLPGADFRREIVDIVPPHDIYTHISGIDIIRDEEGEYLILEDNLRTPSGVSYMIENRIIERRILPEFFNKYRVRRVEHYPALLLAGPALPLAARQGGRPRSWC